MLFSNECVSLQKNYLMSIAFSQNIQDIQEQGAEQVTAPTTPATSVTTVLQTQNNKTGVKQRSDLKKVKVAKNAFVLSKTDSVNLNIVQVKPTTLGFFDNNILSRTLQPVAEMPDEMLVVKIDSTNSFVAKNEYTQLVVKEPVKTTLDTTKIEVKTDSTFKALVDTVIPKPIEQPQTTTTYVAKERSININAPFGESKLFLVTVIVLSVFLLGYLRLNSSRFLKTIFKGIWSHHEFKRLFSTVNIRNSVHSVVLDFLFVFNMGILTYQIVSIFSNSTSLFMSILLFLGSMIGVSIYFLLKKGIFKTIGYIFSTKEQTNEYLFFVGIINKTYGIILTPILVILPFVTGIGTYIVVSIALILYLLLYIIQLFRGFKIILGKAVSLFYFIMYLCTLEILPAIIVYRFLSK